MYPDLKQNYLSNKIINNEPPVEFFYKKIVRKKIMWLMAVGRQNDVLCGDEGRNDVVYGCG